jgi:hypothetical protein
MTKTKVGARFAPTDGSPTSAARKTTTSRPNEAPLTTTCSAVDRRIRCSQRAKARAQVLFSSRGFVQRTPSATNETTSTIAPV